MLTSEQIRAARAMLRIEQTALAEMSGVSVESIRRFEKMDGEVRAQEATLVNIKRALEKAGVIFLGKNEHSHDGGAGVRLASSEAAEEWNTKVDEVLSSIPGALHKSDYEEIATDYSKSIDSDRIIAPEEIEAVISKFLELAAERLFREPHSHGGLLDLMEPPEGNPEDTHQKKRFRIPIYDNLVEAGEKAAEHKRDQVRDLDEKIESAKAKQWKQDE